MNAKIFTEGRNYKTVKVKVELTIYTPDDKDGNQVTNLTTDDVKKLVEDMERVDLGEKVLNALDTAEVITE